MDKFCPISTNHSQIDITQRAIDVTGIFNQDVVDTDEKMTQEREDQDFENLDEIKDEESPVVGNKKLVDIDKSNQIIVIIGKENNN
jgi:hypothetical protein